MKFTFKQHKPEGRYRSFFNPTWDIKLNKKCVGHIYIKKRDKPGKEFQIWFHVLKKDIVEDGNPNCPWKNIKLKATFKTIEETKQFLNDHIFDITTKWTLYPLED